ncbi:MAG: Aspartyl-tRNA synthetase [Candidatus Jorgensenbacteria bacterium GW2011_GWA1_48_13]|uniref:Aspartate--tRNA(Asp/Asn) ligase n=1 Tax=Candidatus Jorgensenbacteria bacterium GW2011_GWB1_50_10 TaxID=1618665 RepID=A0A0G1W9M7_9BACT|nr:MAG: Aspartyl-tRNA synthetase [Candidatus Jorgensenbacteria bacterium GW2011_GWA1_48_13]KKW15501.1 MAG: Aspartyl-tRNA synthetase [Candidatus Jorgensenbacteria bacterium GW2011_GWB1_50_10]
MKGRILAGEISKYEGEEVKLKGWVDSRRDHGGLIFIDVRDRSGLAQVVFNPKKDKKLHEIAEELRPEWVVAIRGEVVKRPKGMENPKILGGEFEVVALKLEVLAQALPVPLDVTGDGADVGEEIRMKYRYLDLRRPRMQKNIRMRDKVIKFFRDYLTARDFVEIETPHLSKSTPEGARDYVVPSRLHAGKFYALPQSPQQYKQLLMVAGFEKYFQIARVFRDEDTRGDRQPEHTQLDIEMSFTSPEEVMSLVEEMVTEMIGVLYSEKRIETPWPRLDYADAMKKYSTDKPDLRKDKNDPNEVAFCWIVDFPQFELDKATKQIQPVHHMFVEPAEGGADLLDSEPLKMTSTQYDWVCNGYELASGSLRITDPTLQMKVFKLLGMSEEKARADFGHLLEAFSFGVPPHGGIAPGIDRLVMILQNEPNIREVIAFPKTGDGRDLMMDSPSEVSKKQLKELHLKIDKKEK